MRARHVPEVTDQDITNLVNEADIYVVALQRVLDVLDNPKLSRLQMAEVLADQMTSLIKYYNKELHDSDS